MVTRIHTKPSLLCSLCLPPYLCTSQSLHLSLKITPLDKNPTFGKVYVGRTVLLSQLPRITMFKISLLLKDLLTSMFCSIGVSTIFGRNDAGTFLSNDFHLLWACLNEIPQDAALYLADHMENQALLHGNQRIGNGAFITPIAQHFNVPLPSEPVSTSIYLDRSSLQQQEMLSFDREGYFWKLHGMQGVRIFPLPAPT